MDSGRRSGSAFPALPSASAGDRRCFGRRAAIPSPRCRSQSGSAAPGRESAPLRRPGSRSPAAGPAGSRHPARSEPAPPAPAWTAGSGHRTVSTNVPPCAWSTHSFSAVSTPRVRGMSFRFGRHRQPRFQSTWDQRRATMSSSCKPTCQVNYRAMPVGLLPSSRSSFQRANSSMLGPPPGGYGWSPAFPSGAPQSRR